MPKTLPGLAGLYLCGHWVELSGMVPVCAMLGRNAIQLLCHADRRRFVATLPYPDVLVLSETDWSGVVVWPRPLLPVP
jgi:hypothetical protein